MKTLLRIDASVRHEGSYSRSIGDYFTNKWIEKNPHGVIAHRDLASKPVPHLNGEVAKAFFVGERDVEALNISNELCDELKHCDEMLLTCPMYNFGMPSTLKAYFDHVVRVRETFQYTETLGYKGLLEDKKAYVVLSRGGEKGHIEAHDAFESYFMDVLAFMGISKVKLISIEGTAKGEFSEDWQIKFQTEIMQLINE